MAQLCLSAALFSPECIYKMNKQMYSFRLSQETLRKIDFIYAHTIYSNRTAIIEEAVDYWYKRLKTDYLDL